MATRTYIRVFAECLIVTVAVLFITFEFVLFLGLIPVFFTFPYAMCAWAIFCWALHLPGWPVLGITLPLALLQYPLYWIVLQRFYAKRQGKAWIVVLVCAHIITTFTGIYVSAAVGVL